MPSTSTNWRSYSYRALFMPPKPFPYPIGIGIDVCNPSRIFRIMKNQRTLNHWLRKVFNRLEWPLLVSRFKIAENAGPGVGHIRDVNRYQPLILSHSWIPPAGSEVPAVTDALAQHLAGRWAAKEAVIKAHRHRKLGFQDISIIDIDPRGAGFEAEAGIRFNLNAAIDPPTRSVQMDQRVAILRGLRGFRGDEEETSAIIGQAELADLPVKRKQGHLVQSEGLRIPMHGPYLTRRSLVKDEDRQIAELSITHENTVAVAVCMAWKDPSEEMIGELEPIIDDGSGESMHEPAWGDRGFSMARTIPNEDG